ncbi:helix-turn-helix transcriptional regulator [Rufibacter sp. LB8]|uniref:helix-turn-helix domain-containing protein n=1 Tax=Rufibacter sp. LB8 TaxID=2777781 RepID=UPI00178C1F36|nr:helix-turn-helix transcriptional regulator [Rufibacter sp. LB8]
MENISPNDRLKEVREKLGMSQTAFSSKLGFKQSYISAVESGKKKLLQKSFTL